MEKVSITCPECQKTFKETANKVRAGLKLPCPACKAEIHFEAKAENLNIRKALSAAKRVRLASSPL